MEVKDLLLSRSEISQASIWQDEDGTSRIHMYCIEIEERISILTTLKIIRTFIIKLKGFPQNGEVDNFIGELESIMAILNQRYSQIVEGKSDLPFKSSPWKRCL